MGKAVRLEFGPEPVDAYGRTLGYVYFERGDREELLAELFSYANRPLRDFFGEQGPE